MWRGAGTYTVMRAFPASLCQIHPDPANGAARRTRECAEARRELLAICAGRSAGRDEARLASCRPQRGVPGDAQAAAGRSRRCAGHDGRVPPSSRTCRELWVAFFVQLFGTHLYTLLVAIFELRFCSAKTRSTQDIQNSVRKTRPMRTETPPSAHSTSRNSRRGGAMAAKLH